MVRDFRLGPSRRIKRRKDFLQIQSRGRKIRSKHFLIAVHPRQNVESGACDSRVGITITRKVHKRAVRRNRLRRRVREVFRHFRPRLSKPVDIVVIALTGATELEFSEVKDELDFVFRKLNRPQRKNRTNRKH